MKVRRAAAPVALSGWAAYAIRSLAAATADGTAGVASPDAAAAELCTVVDKLYAHCVGTLSASQWALGLALLGTFYEDAVDPFGQDLTVRTGEGERERGRERERERES